VYGYPPASAALVALTTIREWLSVPDNAVLIDRVIFCVFLSSDLTIYKLLLPVVFPVEVQPQPGPAIAAAGPEAAGDVAGAAAAGGAGGQPEFRPEPEPGPLGVRPSGGAMDTSDTGKA
jgi:hypothetical protein